MEISVDSLETPALTKAQLADMLYQQIGLNKRESKDMIEAFFDLITQSLVDGNDVKISGFGCGHTHVQACIQVSCGAARFGGRGRAKCDPQPIDAGCFCGTHPGLAQGCGVV